jgi:hypothetical protein
LSKDLLKSKGEGGYCRLKVLSKEGIDLSKDLLKSKGEVGYRRSKVVSIEWRYCLVQRFVEG